MRRSELLALRWQDVDFTTKQISVNRALHQRKDGTYEFRQPKTAKGKRTIALTPRSLAVMQQYYEERKQLYAKLGIPLTDDTLLFCHPESGKPIRPNTITRAWSIIARKAGLKHIRLHDIRHSHVSILIKQGVNPKVVQERLGHSSIQITLDTYSTLCRRCSRPPQIPLTLLLAMVIMINVMRKMLTDLCCHFDARNWLTCRLGAGPGLLPFCCHFEIMSTGNSSI